MSSTRQQTNRTRHLFALGGGVLSTVVVTQFPGGVLGYLGMIGISLTAVLICHGAIRKPGRFHWSAIVGLGLSFLCLIVAVGLLIVRVMRIVSGMA